MIAQRLVLRPRSLPALADLACVFVRVHARRVLAVLPIALLPVPLAHWTASPEAPALPWLTVWLLGPAFGAILTTLSGDLVVRDDEGGPPGSAAGSVATMRLRQLSALVGRWARNLPWLLLVRVLDGGLKAISLGLLSGPLFFAHEIRLLEDGGVAQTWTRGQRLLGATPMRWLTAPAFFLAVVIGGAATGDAVWQGLRSVLGVPTQPSLLWSQGYSLPALVGACVAQAWLSVVRFLAYLDARTRREGWDLQLGAQALADSLRQPGAAPSRHPQVGAVVLALSCAAVLLHPGGLAAAATPPAHSALPPAREVARILAEHEWDFCDGALPISPADAQLCALSAQVEGCPGFALACRRYLDREAAPAPRTAGKLGKTALDAPPRRPRAEQGSGLDLLAARDVFLGVAVAVVLWIAWQLWRRRRHEGPLQLDPAAPQAPAEVQPQLPAQRQSVHDCLRRAAELVERDPAHSAAWLYAALLSDLQNREVVAWDETLSNRRVLSALRGQSLHAPTRELVRLLEAARFGGVPPTPAQAAGLLDKLAPLLRQLAVLLVVVALGGCALAGDAGPRGRSLAWTLLKGQGYRVESLVGKLDGGQAGQPPLWVDAQGQLLDAETLVRLNRAATQGRHIVVFAGGNQSFSALLSADATAPAVDATQTSDCAAPEGPDDVTRVAMPPLARGLQLQDPDDAYALMVSPDKLFAAQWAVGEGDVALVADDAFLTNVAVAVPANAEALVGLAALSAGDARHLQVATLAALDAPDDPSETLDRAGLWPLIVQLLAVALAFGVAAGAAFGLRRDRHVRTRRAFSEHVRALAHLLRRAQAYRWPAARYSAYVLDRLHRRRAAGAVTDPQHAALIEEVEHLRATADGPDTGQEAALMARLDALWAADSSSTATPAGPRPARRKP